ncbi:hypothetical protein [Klebsiella pneumoniae]|nr:hypothetical protein [Klebsiella pneumoniae]SJN07924.1 hypothetical protein STCB_5212 [Klebsiella pneumoniae]
MLIQFHHPGRAETFTGGVVHLRRIAHGQTQTGDTGVNGFQVVRSAHRGDIAGRQLGQPLFSVAVGFFRYHVSGFVFTTRRFQVEHADHRAEQQEVDEEEHHAHHQQHPDVFAGGRQAVHQHVVNCTCGEGEARMDPERRCDEQADTGQHRMQEVQQRSQEHEQEFQRLGYPGQERGDGHGQQHTAYHRTTRFRRRQIHRQRRTRQTKHHDWEEAGHEHPRGAVAGVEAVDVAVEHSASGVSELTNLEPGDSVQHLMQTGWDQQTVDETKDTGTQRPCGDDPFAARVDSVLHRRPDVAEDRREDQTEEAGGDRHEAFAAEEAQEVRQLDAGPAVVYRPCHQTGNDTGQHAHIDFRVDGDHRFGHHEIPYRTGQRRRTGVILGPA